MLKKMKADAAAEPEGESKDLAQSVLDSSRQIWLAGLGAFARAQAEGQKVFESLVKQGESLETKTKQAAMDTAAAARGAAKAKAKEVQAMAGGTWDKLEQVFEDRVARALSKLGVHTQSDVERLAERVDALSERVNELIKRTGASKPRRESPPAPEGKTAAAKKRSTTRAATTAAKKARRAATKGERTH